MANTPNVEHTIGADLNHRHIKHALSYFPDIDFVIANAERLLESFEENSFAFVTSGQTIEHLLDPVSFIAGIVNILDYSGIFALMSPTHNDSPLCIKPTNPWHVFEYNPVFLRELLSFFFEDVRMGEERPFAYIFDYFRQVAGSHVNVPIADAVVCEFPRKRIPQESIKNFRSHYLERFYRTIIEQTQQRMVNTRRETHFLRDAYPFFDIVRGIYNPEPGQMWTASEATIRLLPTKCPVKVRMKTVATKENPRTVDIRFDDEKKQQLIFLDGKEQVVEIDKVLKPINMHISVSPPFLPGGKDIRTLGVSITGIQALLTANVENTFRKECVTKKPPKWIKNRQ